MIRDTNGSGSEWPRMAGAVVHIGAGMRQDAGAYLAAGAHRVVIVEADPLAAQALRHRHLGDARVEVVSAAVTGDERGASLYQYNLDDLQTLSLVRHPSVRWPGLRQVCRTEVASISFGELMRQLQLEEGGHWLVIDAPNQGEFVLRPFATFHQARQLFSNLYIYTSEKHATIAAELPVLSEAPRAGGLSVG